MRRLAPRPLGTAVEALAADLAPATPLAAVQGVWAQVVGEVIAGEARPTAERDGVVTVSCRAAVWAQELDLMGPELVTRLNSALRHDAVRALRCRSSGL
jgi:predicted nucleic acid-binding Zn ribbon protein